MSLGLEGDIDFYVELARAAPPALELGCGTGRVTIPIARASVPVTGLDVSMPMLHAARDKSEDLAPVRWIHGDMRRFALEERFGVILIPYRGFLHMLTEADQRSTLRCVWRHLRPGGRLALNIFNPSAVVPAMHMHSQPLFSRSQRGTRLRYVFREEMEQLLEGAGFEIEALFGWFDRRPFDDHCTEMIWLARRPSIRAYAARSASEFQR